MKFKKYFDINSKHNHSTKKDSYYASESTPHNPIQDLKQQICLRYFLFFCIVYARTCTYVCLQFPCTHDIHIFPDFFSLRFPRNTHTHGMQCVYTLRIFVCAFYVSHTKHFVSVLHETHYTKCITRSVCTYKCILCAYTKICCRCHVGFR